MGQEREGNAAETQPADEPSEGRQVAKGTADAIGEMGEVGFLMAIPAALRWAYRRLRGRAG